MNDLLFLVILLPLVPGVMLTASIGRRSGAAAAWIAGLVTLAALAILLQLAPEVFAGRTLLAQRGWIPELGLNLGLRLDGLALLFGLLITGIGALVVLYAQYYLGPEDSRARFYALLMLFMAAMLGVVLSDNLLLLVVFWELTSISSFLLVGYWGHKAEARAGARMALSITGGGGLALLAGVVLLGQIGGSYELSELLLRGDAVRAHPQYPLMLGLVLLGCFTKSAQFPFHFWLPEAMAAPTPASAYLHSATMVKAGVFLIARLYPVLGGSLLFEVVVAGTGLLTLAFAAYVAVFRHDIKGLLAYSTISHLGLIVFLLGLDSPLSALAAVFHIINHAIFKASLFMTAGIIDHETGTRDMRRLSGLMRFMPWTATLAMVAAAAMAGVPLFNGFLSKEMFFAEALDAVDASWGWIVPAIATLAGACSVAYSLRFIHDVFFNGEGADLPRATPHEPPLFMKLPVALLVVLVVAIGVLPALLVGPLVQVAADAVLGMPAPQVRLALWHGFNMPLLMSALASLGGVAFYWALARHYRLHLHHPRGITGRLLFTHATDGLFGIAGRTVARLENGSLQRYAAWMLGSAILIGAWPLIGAGIGAGMRAPTPASPLALALWALLLAAGAALLHSHRQRFTAVVLTGVVGLVTALAFAGLSAPDLALTQLAVEVISAVLLMMGLALLPATTPVESSRARRLRDALLALAGGGAMAWVAWLAMTREHDSISWYFVAQSLPQGGGSNAVNVILVDFRGYDTLGEITVLAIAGIGALAMLDGLRLRRPAIDEQGRAWSFPGVPLLLRALAQLVLPLALVVAVHLFWRGHNLPGGGFVAGLITAAALVLQYMALGQDRADGALRATGGRRFTVWIGVGLLIAALTGVGSFAFEAPFLTSSFGHPVVPGLGEMALASAALFDLGVYITVVGATLLTLSVLGSVAKGEQG